MTQTPASSIEQHRRRPRTILLARGSQGGRTEALFRTLAENLGAELKVSSSSLELCAAADDVKEGVCLISIEVGVPDAIQGARECAKTSPNAEIVMLAAPDETEPFKLRLGAAPRLGSHWQIVSPEASGFERLLRTAFRRADQRRVTRTTLDRFNARLTAPALSVDTAEIRQLVLSDRFLSSLLDSAFDAVVLIDRKGVVTAFNPAAERLFQKRKEDAVSSPGADLSKGAWPDDLRHILAGAQSGELMTSSIDLGSDKRDLEISATPVCDRTGAVIATSLIVRDITQRRLTEDALRTSEKLAVVGRLASSIAHEINNPLESVTNLLYLARNSEDFAEVARYLQTADEELRRVSAITNQTLRFHRQASAPVSVTAAELMESVLAIFGAKILNAQVQVEVQHQTERKIKCMDGEIRQVLGNLVGNAIDAMASTGGRLRIRSRETMHRRSSHKGIVFTVADTGTGITQAVGSKIFDPFFTTKGATGSGLGLWVSQEIVARHRGTITLWSSTRKGQSGTVFRLFLPFDGISR